LKINKKPISSEENIKNNSGISFKVGGNLDIKKQIADKPTLFGELNASVLDTDENKIKILPSIKKQKQR
jgi:hypothetical protein